MEVLLQQLQSVGLPFLRLAFLLDVLPAGLG